MKVYIVMSHPDQELYAYPVGIPVMGFTIEEDAVRARDRLGEGFTVETVPVFGPLEDTP